MTRAYSYIRFSTPEQLKGDSLRRQLDLSAAYASAHGLELDQTLTFRDLGVSAFNRSNLKQGGQLGEFLKAVDRGVVEPGSYLLVESLDRISRAQILDALETFTGLLNRGIRIVTLADGMEYTKERANERFTDLIISITIMSRAHEESLTKSRRLSAAWEAKRSRISELKLTSLCPAWLKLNESRTGYVFIEERVATVRRIIALTLAGMGKNSIAKLLNEEKVPTFGERGTRSWFPSYISKILSNRALMGEFQPHKVVEGVRTPVGDAVADYFPALLQPAEFTVLGDRVSARGARSGGARGERFSNLFTGITYCGYCGGKMLFVNKGPGKKDADPDANKMLVCSNAKRGVGCHYVGWQYAKFEHAFLSLVRGIDFQRFLASGEAHDNEIQVLEQRCLALQAELDDYRTRQGRLLEALEGATSPPGVVIDRLKDLDSKILQLTVDLSKAIGARNAAQQQRSLSATAASTIDALMSRMHSGDATEQYLVRSSINEHLRRVIEAIKLYPGGLLHSEADIQRVRAESSGFPPAEVEAFINKHMPVLPRKEDRFFTVSVRGRMIQILRPDADVPDWQDTQSETPLLSGVFRQRYLDMRGRGEDA